MVYDFVEANNKVRMEFDAISSNEAFARTVVAAYLMRFDPLVSDIEDIKTAVSEAVTNAIVHGYGGAGGMVSLACKARRIECAQEKCNQDVSTIMEHSSIEVAIEIEDKGKGIDKLELARKPLYTTCRDGERAGLGFTVMEAFMDELHVESKLNIGTKIQMLKRLQSASIEAVSVEGGGVRRNDMNVNDVGKSGVGMNDMSTKGTGTRGFGMDCANTYGLGISEGIYENGDCCDRTTQQFG